jgi:hypothetical protein
MRTRRLRWSRCLGRVKCPARLQIDTVQRSRNRRSTETPWHFKLNADWVDRTFEESSRIRQRRQGVRGCRTKKRQKLKTRAATLYGKYSELRTLAAGLWFANGVNYPPTIWSYAIYKFTVVLPGNRWLATFAHNATRTTGPRKK